MTDIPLYQLEAARSQLEDLFDPDRGCCFTGHTGVPCGAHDGHADPRDHPEYRTLSDLLDHVIETKRRENEAHRVTVATGGRA